MESILQKLFDQKHMLPVKQLKKLDDKHKKILSKMIKGTAVAPDRTVAMNALTKIAPAAARSAIGDMLLDKDTPAYLRAVAATQLGRLGGEATEQKLIDSLKIDKTLVFQIKVAAALGKSGTANSFQALQKMTKQHESEALRRQAALSQVIISFRNNQNKYKPHVPDSKQLLVPRKDLVKSFKIEPGNKSFLNKVLEDIAQDMYGIESSDHVMHALCGRNNYAVVLNKSILETDIKNTFNQPLLTGLIAQQAMVDQSWATRFLLFSWPESKTVINLAGYRTDGYQSYSGSVTIDAGVGQIELTAVRDAPNTPSIIKGYMKDNVIKFTELETEDRVIGKQRPIETKMS